MVCHGVLTQFIDSVQPAFHEQVAASPAHFLVDVQRKVGSELVLPDEQVCAVGLGDLVHFLVEVGRGSERY